MPQNTVRRRRGIKQSASSQKTVETTDSSTATHETEKRPKSVPELLEEENASFKNFMGLAALACLLFIHMLQNTRLPYPGRVYAIMIDAGSTGTRAQVFSFRFNSTEQRLTLQSTTMFAQNRSIDVLTSGTSPKQFFKPLLEKLKKAVPGMRRRKRTPIALHATAGLRLLGEEKAERALDIARSALNSTEFLFKQDWVSVLSESDEANYAWVTTNYLLGNFDPGRDEKQFVGALELGGASMQIVFHDNGDIEDYITSPPDPDTASEEDSKEQKREFPASETHVDIFGQRYKLHSRNHLGLGLVNFKKKLYGIFDHEGVLEEGNPCFRLGQKFKKKKLKIQNPGGEESKVVNIVGDGDFDRCVASAEIAISSYSRLNEKRSHLPDRNSFYAFAYFYDKTVKLGLSSKLSKKEMIEKGKQLCEQKKKDEPVEFDESCAEFSYIFAVMKILTDDFLESKSDVTFEQYVNGHMLGWALGAVLDTLQPDVIAKQIAVDSESLIMT
ncbi:Nucleoside phosphatase GDA1/CD39 [Gracilaria domingensis]|nr:Nucleoside phosphatase GDA1/CD39 [Gracilaria domingensis]